jgi:predicted metal-dependent HD superfamily phosphohydrolase
LELALVTDPVPGVDLLPQWLEVLQPFGVSIPVAEAAFTDLVRAYSSPGRFYHTLAHIRAVLAWVRSLQASARDPAAVQLAAWFHDVVYDPRAGDNEERSADLAEQTLRRLGVPADTVATVHRLILQTKTHQADDPNAAVLLDADLAILGAAEEQYAAYARAIRTEYTWVPDEQYRQGRSAVLRGFLQRERIFRTDTCFIALEARARENLAREIQALA